MPKKHQPSYTSIKPTASSSLQSSRPSSSNPPPPTSVNERIQQLRREQAPRTTSQRRDEITEVVTRRTVPPQLRRILHLAEVDAPKPKPGTRARAPLRPGQRPPPGPAAPSSWLSSSRHALAHVRNSRRKYNGGPSRFCKLTKAHHEDYQCLPLPGSLVHQCLRTFALHWEELAEYEQHYLPTLPVPLKEAMLSYLSIYGSKECMDFKTFKILFQGDKEVDSATGSEDVRFLDLTGLLNEKFTLKDLEKSLQRRDGANTAVTSIMATLSVSAPNVKAKTAAIEVAESWEDAVEVDELTSSVLPATLNIPSFPNLTRLSLAHPGPSASWTDLLAISPYLNTLTHLSLAYWPRPSTTPNAATTSMVSRHTTVNLGGTHFYSDLDDDWHEAANILRRLSLNTYCLTWLDLEGCTWLKALTWNLPTITDPSSISLVRYLDHEEDWAARHMVGAGPDWNAAWRQITYLNFFQGWIPSDRQSLQNMPAGVVPVRLMRWLREHEKEADVKEVLSRDGGYMVAEWVEKEKVARAVGSAVQGVRKAGGGKWCVVDYGWGGEG